MFQPQPLPRTLEAALRDIEHTKPKVRRSAVQDLARLATGSERPAALAVLRDRVASDADSDVRADAVLALTDCEAGSALTQFVAAVADPHPRVRQMALIALGELGPRGHKDSCVAIVAALEAEVPAVRFQALIAAARHRVSNLEGLLRNGLNDEDAKVRYVALRILEEHWVENEPEQASLDGVTDALADLDPTVAVAAAMLLGPLGSEPAAPLLALAINRGQQLPAPEDEQTLIELAGELGLAAAMPGLRRHAWGRFGVVPGRFFWQARVVLARLGDEKASRFILRGLKGWDRDARTLSIVAAGRAGLTDARPVLEELAREGGPESETIAEALALLRTKVDSE